MESFRVCMALDMIAGGGGGGEGQQGRLLPSCPACMASHSIQLATVVIQNARPDELSLANSSRLFICSYENTTTDDILKGHC